MEEYSAVKKQSVRIGIIGAGAVSDFHHVPGIRIDTRSTLTAVCDPDQKLLQKRKSDWGDILTFEDYRQIAACDEVDAVIIATPNFTHHAIAIECVRNGKHVMCEKPLGLNYQESEEMYLEAKKAGVRHMTAFTYRFAPSMRYLRHLISAGALGVPRHFRSQRFLDLPETSWGWRQNKALAGAGDLFDMTIHRIDFAQDLLGPIRSVCGAVATYAPRDRTADGKPCEASTVDDWSALIGTFESGAVGVWEGSTLMKGYKNSGMGFEWAEINGSEGSAVYQLTDPNNIRIGSTTRDMEVVPVPAEYLVPAGSPRDPSKGSPSTVFRYDLVWEFVSAILEERDAVPGFHHGATAQAVADSVLTSYADRRWVDVPQLKV